MLVVKKPVLLIPSTARSKAFCVLCLSGNACTCVIVWLSVCGVCQVMRVNVYLYIYVYVVICIYVHTQLYASMCVDFKKPVFCYT